MRTALIFLSGVSMTVLIFWMLEPLCSFAAFTVGWASMGIAGLVTLFLSNVLEKK